MGSLFLIYVLVNVVGIPTTLYACGGIQRDDGPPYVDLPTVAPLNGDVDW